MEYQRHRLDPRVSSVLGRLSESPEPEAAQALMERLSSFVAMVEPRPEGPQFATALAPAQWLLDRAADGGIPLTEAGYLKPADVKAFAAVLPQMEDWIFPVTREVNVQPLHGFRRFVQRVGLLRKNKGALVITPAGRKVRTDPTALWTHLADRLIPGKPAFDEDCAVVGLIHLASQDSGSASIDVIAETMGHLGWSHSGGLPVTGTDVSWVTRDLKVALANLGPLCGTSRERRLSPAALSLIRDALVEYTTTM